MSHILQNLLLAINFNIIIDIEIIFNFIIH